MFNPPWYQDVANNPNINRHGPPPPPVHPLEGPPIGGHFVPVGSPPPPIFAAPPPPPMYVAAPAPPPPVYIAGPPPGPPPAFVVGWDHGPPPPPLGHPVFLDHGPGYVLGDHPREPHVLPGGHQPGVAIMFDEAYCHFRVIDSPYPPWQVHGLEFDFETFQVGIDHDVDFLIRRLRKGMPAHGYAVSEIRELGNGMWDRMTTYMYGTQQSAQKLRDIGWDERRGRELASVWIYLHRA